MFSLPTQTRVLDPGELQSKAPAPQVPFSIPQGLLFFYVAVLDVAAVCGGFLLGDAAYLWDDWASSESVGIEVAQTLGIALIAACVFLASVALRRGYTTRVLFDYRHQFMVTMQCWFIAIFSLGWLAFLTKTTNFFSRGAFTLSFVLVLLLLIAVRATFFGAVRSRIAASALVIRRVFLIHVGHTADFERVHTDLAARGIQVVRSFHVERSRLARGRYETLLAEAARSAIETLAKSFYEEIYVVFPWGEARAIEELRSPLARIPVPVFLCADATIAGLTSGTAIEAGSMRAYEIQRAPLSRWERAQKRALDIAASGLAILMLLPLLALVSLGVLLESGRPIIFRQSRKGFGGHPFRILKFRSMTVCEDGGTIKQAERNDMRVTRLGRILRRTSIDELPQLFNVLRGDMSLVGPRPHAVAHDSFYDRIIANYALRHHVKPGITGWAQVNGSRGETREVHQMEERLRHDLWYINHWSIWLDIRILVTTAWTLVAHRAY